MTEREITALRNQLEIGSWRRLFLQARHLEPQWLSSSSRTSRWKHLKPQAVPRSLLMESDRDLLFVEIYFSCRPSTRKLIKPAASRTVRPLWIEQAAVNFPNMSSERCAAMSLPLNVRFGSRFMEFADRHAASLELRVCARIDGRVVLIIDTAIDHVASDDDVDREGEGVYERALALSHKDGLLMWARFNVRRVREARTLLVHGKPVRHRAEYCLEAVSLDDDLETYQTSQHQDAPRGRPGRKRGRRREIVGHGAAAFRSVFCP